MILKDLLNLKDDLYCAIERNIANDKVEWLEEPQVISNVESSRKGKTLVGNHEINFRFHIKLGKRLGSNVRISIYENEEDLRAGCEAKLCMTVRDNKESLEF